ncbi:phasin family protein [Pokkaliibacter sp. CJK22405]|uniref:phasin family protein n=1 Tax=Pokkaliibacter sp. CJK22405 TaxID=3384615 RepID=UPI00398481DC
MYEAYLTDLSKVFAPMTEAMEINKKAFEKLSSTQSAYLTDVSSKVMKQSQALMDTKDLKNIVDMQMSFAKELESRFLNTFEESMSTMNEARESYSELLEKHMSEMSEQAPFFDMSKFVDLSQYTMDKAKAAAKSSARTASKTVKAAADAA